MEGNDQSTMSYISFNESELDFSDYSNFGIWTNNILNSFNEIKALRKNFILDEYGELTKKIRDNIRDIRKIYFNEKSGNENIKKQKKKNNIQSNSNQQYSSTNKSNIITNNIPSNRGNNNNTNTNSGQENINSNVNTNTYNKISKLNETSTSFLENRIEYKQIYNNKKNMHEIYNILLEDVSFLLCYEDIYINYENKSSYFTLKLFLQMSNLHFFKNIEKHDFILMLINKISNILIKYNYLDESTKKIIALNEKKINNLKGILIYDKKFMRQIQKKLKIELDKIDLSHKVEKIKEEKILENLIIDKEKELEINFEDDINHKFHKLNLENEILE